MSSALGAASEIEELFGRSSTAAGHHIPQSEHAVSPLDESDEILSGGAVALASTDGMVSGAAVGAASEIEESIGGSSAVAGSSTAAGHHIPQSEQAVSPLGESDEILSVALATIDGMVSGELSTQQ